MNRRAAFLTDEDFTPEDRSADSRPPPRSPSTSCIWDLRPDAEHRDDTTDTETDADELYQELIPDDHTDQTITPDNPFLINMTNTAVAVAKEIKIASPTPFTGDPEKTKKFL